MSAGRPSIYSAELATSYLERISDGESQRSVCRDDAMPDRATIARWEAANEEFAAKCARAYVAQGQAKADEMDELQAKLETGEIAADVGRIIMSKLQWQASKLHRARYGDKTLIGSDPENPLPTGFQVNLVKGPGSESEAG